VGVLRGGERQARTSVEAPDLAYLLAAGMEIAERPLRFGFEEAERAGTFFPFLALEIDCLLNPQDGD